MPRSRVRKGVIKGKTQQQMRLAARAARRKRHVKRLALLRQQYSQRSLGAQKS